MSRNRALLMLAKAQASTKRNPAPVSGKVGAPVTHLPLVIVTEPLPPSQETRKDTLERYQIKSPVDMFTSYTIGTPDILNGDLLIVGEVTYNVRAAVPWRGLGADYTELILERVKAT